MKTGNLIDHHFMIFRRSIGSIIHFIPESTMARVIQDSLNIMFSRHLDEQKITFLMGKKVRINVTDLNISFDLTLPGKRLSASRPNGLYDLELTTNHLDILSLATGEVDSDTLFFKRRIKISGDTELSLQIKNFLDTIQVDNLYPDIFNRAMQRYLDACKKSAHPCAQEMGNKV